MNVSDAVALWEFSPLPVSQACVVVCPVDADGCGRGTPLAEWFEGSVGCELCGEHTALVCPDCGEPFDHVWGPVFTVLPPG